MRAARTVRALLATMAYGLCVASAAAQAPDAPYGKAAGGKVPFRTLTLAGGHSQVDVPQRDWQLGSAFGNTAAVLISKKGDATVIIQRVPLEVPISEADMTELFEGLQVDEITKGQAGLGALSHAMKAADGRRYLTVSFTRTGAAGPEQVLVYVFNGGSSLYRLVCITLPDGRAKYAPVFGHMAATLKVAPAGAGAQ
jgi:hypothetical protein